MDESRMFNKRFSSMFKVGRGVGQVIPTGVNTPIQWDVEAFDELNEMLIINPWTFTPALTGYYYLYASAIINNLNVGDYLQLAFRVDGVVDISSIYNYANSLNEEVALNVSGLVFLTPANAVDVIVFHNFGANRTLQGNSFETQFFGFRVR